MKNLVIVFLLLFAIGLTGCGPDVGGDPAFEKKKADPEELKKLEDPTNKEQKSPPA